MSLAHTKRPGFWYALIWKDVCQLKQITSYLAAGLLAAQALLLLWCFVGPEQVRSDSMVMQWVIASTGVMIFMLAAPAMSAGHERQERTWAWQSTLPQSWLQSLTSKVSAAALVGLIFGVALCIVPMLTQAMLAGERLSVTATPADVFRMVVVFASIALEVAAISMLGSLLFRETLHGILLVGAAAIAIHVGLYFFLLEGIVQTRTATSWPSWIDWVIYGQLLGAPALLAIASLVAYRWRWKTGQFSDFSLRRSTVIPGSGATLLTARTAQPSVWRSQFSLALRSLLPLKVGTLLVVALVAVCMIAGARVIEGGVFLGAAACVMLGLTAFGGDQTPRVSFLADHGALPRGVFWSRIAASGSFALIAFALVAVACVARMNLYVVLPALLAGGLAAAAALYAFGVYTSITFRTTLYSFAAGLVVLVVVAIGCSVVGSLVYLAAVSQRWSDEYSWATAVCYERIGWAILGCTFASAGILLFATFRSVKPWLVKAKPTGAGWYPAVCALAVLAPVFLGATFGFLLFPSTTQARIDELTQQGSETANGHAKALWFVTTGQRSEKTSFVPIEQYYPPVRWAMQRWLVFQYEYTPTDVAPETYFAPTVDDPETTDEEEAVAEEQTVPFEVEQAVEVETLESDSTESDEADEPAADADEVDPK